MERRRRWRKRDPKNWFRSAQPRHQPNCNVYHAWWGRLVVVTEQDKEKREDHLWSERMWSAGWCTAALRSLSVDRNQEIQENQLAFLACVREMPCEGWWQVLCQCCWQDVSCQDSSNVLSLYHGQQHLLRGTTVTVLYMCVYTVTHWGYTWSVHRYSPPSAYPVHTRVNTLSIIGHVCYGYTHQYNIHVTCVFHLPMGSCLQRCSH